MEPKQQASTDSNHKPALGLWQRAVELAAYPIAAAVGYKTALTSIKRALYKNFVRKGLFTAEQNAHNFETAQKIAATPVAELADTIADLNESYRQTIKTRFGEMGMKTVKDFWKGLHENQKIDAISAGFTNASIAVGALLLIANQIGHFQGRVSDERSNKARSHSPTV